MTGKTSSGYRIFRHDFVCTLRRSLGLVIAGMCIFLVLIPFATAGIPDNSIFNIDTTHDQMMFRFINQSFVKPVWFCIIAYGAVLGFFAFYFLLDKKQTTFYFSVGTTRNRLFAARYLTGVIGTACASAVPMLISYILNRSALGSYEGMTKCFLYVAAGLFLGGLISYTITAIACMLSGVLSEALLFDILFLAGPAGILYCVNKIMIHTVWGNAYGVVFYSGTKGVCGNLTDITSFADPLLFFLDDTGEYSMYYRGFTTRGPADFSVRKLVLWAVILAVLIAAALFLLQRRKAEQAGMSGQCRVMTQIIVTVTIFCAFSVVYVLFDSGSRRFAFVMALLAAALLYLIWQALFLHTEGNLLRRTVFAAVQVAAAVLVFAGICAAGNMRESDIPETSEIASVSMSYAGDPCYISQETSGSSSGTSYYMVSDYSYDRKDDISKIRSIHSELSDMGMQKKAADENDFSGTVVPYDIQITYSMDDGSRRVWYYDRSSLAILEQMLSLDDSVTVQDGIRSVVTGTLADSSPVNWASKAFASGDVYLSNVWYDKPYRLSLSADARSGLLSALAEDISQQSASDRYFPQNEALGVLFFTSAGESDIKSYSYHLGNASVYITEDFTNTFTFLENNGLSECLAFTGEIESITLQKYEPYGGINGRKKPLSNFFIGYRGTSLDDFIVQVDFGAKKPVTDEARIAELLPRLRSTYSMTQEGYLAAVKLKGSDNYIYKYLPGTIDLTK